jgi:hypothetical protein
MWQAKALDFIGRGKDRYTEFSFGQKPDFHNGCNTCIDLCSMIITLPECPCLACEGWLTACLEAASGAT